MRQNWFQKFIFFYWQFYGGLNDRIKYFFQPSSVHGHFRILLALGVIHGGIGVICSSRGSTGSGLTFDQRQPTVDTTILPDFEFAALPNDGDGCIFIRKVGLGG